MSDKWLEFDGIRQLHSLFQLLWLLLGDPELVNGIGSAIGRETRGKGRHVILDRV